MSAEVPSPPPSSSAVVSRRRGAFRVPLVALVLVVGAFALAFAALRIASAAWYAATYTYTVFLLLTSVLAARFTRGRERSFWFGFAVFGWGFFVLGCGPDANPFRGQYVVTAGRQPLNPNLLTTWFLIYLKPQLRASTNNLMQVAPITWNTLGIVHMMMTLAIGGGGGLLASLIRRRPRGRSPAHLVAIVAGLAVVGAVAVAVEPARKPASFFPPGVFDVSGPGEEDPLPEEYSKHLAAMGETPLPPLAATNPKAAVYRFLWLPTFTHPIGVRVDRDASGARLLAVVLDGQVGYEPGGIAIEKIVKWSPEQWGELDRRVDATGFWEKSPFYANGAMMMDGTTLVIEGVKDGRYQAAEIEDPGPLHAAACRYVMAATGLDLSGVRDTYNVRPPAFEDAE